MKHSRLSVPGEGCTWERRADLAEMWTIRRKQCIKLLLTSVILAVFVQTIGYLLHISLQVRWDASMNRLAFKTQAQYQAASKLSGDKYKNKGLFWNSSKRYNVLINSYMNSGSRFTSRFFGFRRDSFYFYEPLWKLSLWGYFDVPSNVCNTLHSGNTSCRSESVADLNKLGTGVFVDNVPSNSTITEMLTGVLDDIYKCNFSRIANIVEKGVHDSSDLTGHSWTEYRRCRRIRRLTKRGCLQMLGEKCKRASQVVTKVLRLTTDALESLLNKQENLKVIHLFRDPRAIINSRLESKGYPIKNYRANAKLLCNKMALDYEGGIRLMKKFPQRFKFVFYEDIKNNFLTATASLYEFVGMPAYEQEIQLLNENRANSPNNMVYDARKQRLTHNSEWWRTYLSIDKCIHIQNDCETVMKYFNLTPFSNRNNMADLKQDAMNLPPVLRIL